MTLDGITFRRMAAADLAVVVAFVDYWLGGRGRRDKVAGVCNDYFVSVKQHFDYCRRYLVLLAFDGEILVGWAVKNRHGVLIHLLVHGGWRRRGIGAALVAAARPEMIRSKMDQRTGDPGAFYEKLGFERAGGAAVGRKGNIELFVKAGGKEGGS